MSYLNLSLTKIKRLHNPYNKNPVILIKYCFLNVLFPSLNSQLHTLKHLHIE